MVDIVIVSLFRLEKTIKCIESLYANCKAFSILVIDNGSDEETIKGLKLLQRKFDIGVMLNGENKRIGYAREQGITYCNAKYILFLDNDMVVEKGFVTNMVKVMEQDKKIGVVGAKVILDGKIQLHGRNIKRGQIDYSYDMCPLDSECAKEQKDVDIIHGGATLYRSEVFDKVKFDDFYKNGYEDLDLMLQIHSKQYRIVYCPDAVAHHFPDRLHDINSDQDYAKIRRNSREIIASKVYFEKKWRIKV